jgi:cyclic beta-1,2-glucan synthetase
VSHTRTAPDVSVYQVEPYVIAADVYGEAPHLGRGGWTWYTGSAGWMFRVALESVLGLTMAEGRELVLKPCIPGTWPGFAIRYRLPGERTTYEIVVEQEARPEVGTTQAEVDGQPLPVEEGAVRIPLVRDGRLHAVSVRLRADVGPRYVPASSVAEPPSTRPVERMTSA